MEELLLVLAGAMVALVIGHKRGADVSGWSGGFLAAGFLYPVLSDTANVLAIWSMAGTASPSSLAFDLDRVSPHTQFHAVSGPIAPLVILLVLSVGIIRGPFRRGEPWAWRALAAGTPITLAVKLWASFGIYMHPVFHGLEQDVWIPLGLWLIGLNLSVPAVRRLARIPASAVATSVAEP